MPTPLNAITGVTINFTNASNPVLNIPYSAIAGTVNRTSIPTSGNDGGLDWWIVGLLQSYANFPSDETHNIVIGQPQAITPTTRNGIENRVTVRYVVTVYSNQQVEVTLDGDNL